MYCTKCGVEMTVDDRFCSLCGARVGGAAMEPAWAAAPLPMPRLMLDKRNGKLGGVCAGFARYFGMDVVLMRILWLVIAFSTGVGFLVYLGAWIALPSDNGFYAPPELPPQSPVFQQRR